MQNKQAFTLVELIVVITILAILSTIGFVSYSSYLAGARDGNRISQLKAISEGLKLYSTNHSLPIPDTTSTSIMDNGTQIATQGYAGSNVLETITYSTEGVDPKDKTYFSYYLTQNKKYFQLMAFLEEEDNLQNTAVGVDYEVRYPIVFGDKLGILTTYINEPIQISTGSIDISNVGNLELKSFLKDGEYVSGTGAIFSKLTRVASLGGRGYEANSYHYDFLWTDLDPIDCPTGFIPVSSDGVFTTKDFCVAKYEMTYADATIPDSSNGRTDWNTMHYNPLKNPVSMAGKYPIADITQSEAIYECKKIGGHLITNNEWMTIARGIEDVSSNWSSGKVGIGNLYNGVSGNIILGCDAEGGNADSRTYATTTGAGTDEGCNTKRSHILYNGQIIWDLSGNVYEHVNKANTVDGIGFDDGQTTSSGSSPVDHFDLDGIYDILDMDKYGSKYHLGTANGMGNIYNGEGELNNIFLRGGAARNQVDAGIFTLDLFRREYGDDPVVGFRCVIL